jgi:hypothetical protein
LPHKHGQKAEYDDRTPDFGMVRSDSLAERNGFELSVPLPQQGQTVPKQPPWDTFRAKKLKFSGLSLGFKSLLPATF